MIKLSNLLRDLPVSLNAEVFQDLASSRHFQLERIVSRGQATPAGEWLSQPRDEWVAVIKGRARLVIKGQADPLEMGTGDYVLIPGGTSHRVDWTDPREETVWLALHF